MAKKGPETGVDLDAILKQRQETKQQMQRLQELELSQESAVSSVDEDWDTKITDESEMNAAGILSRFPEGFDTFSQNHLHYLFTQDTVSIKWLDSALAEASRHEETRYEPSELQEMIGPEFHSLCSRQSTSNVANRYLFYVMSVHEDPKLCLLISAILKRSISNETRPWHVSCSDFVAVILNFGTTTDKINPGNVTINLPDCVGVPEDKYLSCEKPKKAFPLLNLKSVLEILSCCLEIHPEAYKHEEKKLLIHILLLLGGSKGLLKRCTFVQLVKKCIQKLLESYTAEDWAREAWRNVEDLVLASRVLELTGIEDLLWRLDLFSTGNERSVQVQCACAYIALQGAIGMEITVQGLVEISDVVAVAEKFRDVNKLNDDIPLAYRLTRLLGHAVNMDRATTNAQMNALQEVTTLLWKWKHCIFDQDKNCLVDRHDVKNLMTQLHSSWNCFIPSKTFYNI